MPRRDTLSVTDPDSVLLSGGRGSTDTGVTVDTPSIDARISHFPAPTSTSSPSRDTAAVASLDELQITRDVTSSVAPCRLVPITLSGKRSPTVPVVGTPESSRESSGGVGCAGPTVPWQALVKATDAATRNTRPRQTSEDLQRSFGRSGVRDHYSERRAMISSGGHMIKSANMRMTTSLVILFILMAIGCGRCLNGHTGTVRFVDSAIGCAGRSFRWTAIPLKLTLRNSGKQPVSVMLGGRPPSDFVVRAGWRRSVALVHRPGYSGDSRNEGVPAWRAAG